MTKLEILDVKMDPSTNGAKASSVREYLTKLFLDLWTEQENFSVKRPFGNIGWETELYGALVKAGLVAGTFDGGYLDTCDEDLAFTMIAETIRELMKRPQ